MNSCLQVLVLLVAASAPALAAPPRNRLTTVDWESYHEHEHEGPGSYAYGYDVQDPETGNTQFREETRRPDGSVRGSYGLVEPDGNVRIVHYVADEKGFRVHIENSIKPNEVHPAQGPELLEQEVATLGQFGRKLPKLLSQPIVVGALRPAPEAPPAPIVVPTIAEPLFESQRTVPLDLQRTAPVPVSVQPHQRPQTVYVVPQRNMQHFLQYEHSYFHGK